ncbi:MAG: type IV pilus secretin PilQ [Methylotenera sp.]|nr:type IV pilus secretin PilQ [Oligoflexia bacterium]
MKIHSIRRASLATLVSAVVFSLSPSAGAADTANVTKVEFIGTKNPNEVVITGDGPLTFEKSDNTQDRQVVIDIKGAKLANKNAGLRLDTSSFDSKVSLVSPYQVEGQDTVRVVVQLRDAVTTTVSQNGKQIRLSIPSTQSSNSAQNSTAADPLAATGPATGPATGNEMGLDPLAPAGAPLTPASAAKGSKEIDKLSDFASSQESKKFIGKHITLQVRDAEAVDVFRLIGEASGFNIIMGDEVKGKLTLSLVDVPWDLALDTVLGTLRLGAERNGNVLRISTLANLTSQKEELLKAKKASDATAPRVTRIFPISYAKPAVLVAILTKFGNSLNGGATPDANAQSLIQVDERTNSIVVRDLADNVERMKKLIELLDTQTPQILIEAKIVDAQEGFGKSFNGKIGIGRKAGSVTQVAAANGVDFSSSLLGSASTASSVGGGLFGLAGNISFLDGGLLSSLINVAESENQVKIVSSPKTVVLNKETAKIVQGTPVLIPSTSVQNGATINTSSVQEALLSLEVKPTVTNDGNVLMEIKVTNDTPQGLVGGGADQQGIATRNIITQVVTESGGTLVIGGIYTQSDSKRSSGIPYLRKIPIIGALFGSEKVDTTRGELFIFITPRILNEKESGISG